MPSPSDGSGYITWEHMTEQFKRIETLIGIASLIEIICDANKIQICKTEFRIFGPENLGMFRKTDVFLRCRRARRLCTFFFSISMMTSKLPTKLQGAGSLFEKIIRHTERYCRDVGLLRGSSLFCSIILL